MKKIISISLAVTTICWMAGVVAFVPVASAILIEEGDVVSSDATFTDADGNTYYPYDVFIIKYSGGKEFKRLILNPQVFDSYGHFGWSDVKTSTAAELQALTTSELVRAIDDDKVYKLFPDGDVGTKRHVDTLDLFNSLGYDWDSVYIINPIDSGNYTTGTTMAGYEPGVDGDLTLSLASDTPVAATLPLGAQGAVFLKVNVTGTGIISQMTFKRKGAGDTDDFANVYVYENGVRLGGGRSISSSTSKVSFINLGLQAPTTFELVGDIDSSNGDAGNVNYFSLESASDVTTNATVGGTFPIIGNPMGTSGAAVGTITVDRSGSTAYNVTIGEQEVEITAFKVGVNIEGAYIYRIQLFNSGTAAPTYITNLKLKTHATNETIATANEIGSDGYVNFIFDDPYYIKKGANEIFHVYADIGGVKPDRTIILYMELATDLLAIGTTYDFGMRVSDFDDYDGATTANSAITVTCKGGDLTLAKTGPGAKNIGTETDDTVFLEFSMSAAADITIKRTRLYLCWDDSGDGSFDTMTTVLGGGGDLEDIKMVDKDSGTVLVGPVDGSDFDAGTYAGICPGSATAVYQEFTDTFDISAGGQKTLQITADVKVANAALTDQLDLTDTDKILFGLYNWPSWIGTSGNVSHVKYTGTTDAVDDSSISPSSDIAGDEMTIQSAALAIALAASPSGTDATERKFVLGQSDISMTGFVFSAAEASDITVTNLTLTGYIDATDDNTFEPGLNSGNYVKDTISGLELWDVESNIKIAGTKGWSGTNYQDMVWSGLSWVIPAGESKTLLVKADISSSGKATGSSAEDTEELMIDIPDVSTDITAHDNDGNDVTATNDAVNGGGTAAGCLSACNPVVNISVIEKGSITLAKASDTPGKHVLAMGSTDNVVSKFKITGTNEAFLLEKFSIVLFDDGAASEAFRDDFSSVKLKYQTESQWDSSNWKISTGKTFANLASLTFTFSGSDRPYVPKNDDAYISALVDIKGYEGGEGADAGDFFKIVLTTAPGDSGGEPTNFNEFKALGAMSNKYVSASEPAHGDFNLNWIFRSYPYFEKVTWSGDQLELARFSITAMGDDVIFDGTSGDGMDYTAVNGVIITGDTISASLEFEVLASGTDDTLQKLYLYDWNNQIISSILDISLAHADFVTENLASTGSGCSIASSSTGLSEAQQACFTTISFGFEEADAAIIIPKDETKTFYILIDNVVDFNNQDEYISLKLQNDQGGDSATVSEAGASQGGSYDIVWWDDSGNKAEWLDDQSKDRWGMPANIKNIGAFPLSFHQYRGSAQ